MRALFRFLRFAGWPALAGLLAALLILEHWVWPSASPSPATGYRAAVATATPAVVNIFTAKRIATRRNPLLENLFLGGVPGGVPRQRIERSLGSGVILSPDGYILTNNHVIAGADAIQVQLSDGRSAAAEVVGRDPATDLAALHIELEDLTAISLADSEQVSVGDVVLAIGNPLGFGSTVTQGIVSGLGRFGMQATSYEGYIQTDAVIHPGNSGGALVDVEGRLVGINTLIYTSAGNSGSSSVGIGISLAIPSNLAQLVMNDLIRFGQVIRGWLGVSVEQRMENGRPALLVQAVAAGGPAERAGLRAGDNITHIDNEPISDVRMTTYEVSLLRPGERLDVSVLRDGVSVEISAVVGTQPDSEAVSR
jgi:serine protease DegS